MLLAIQTLILSPSLLSPSSSPSSPLVSVTSTILSAQRHSYAPPRQPKRKTASSQAPDVHLVAAVSRAVAVSMRTTKLRYQELLQRLADLGNTILPWASATPSASGTQVTLKKQNIHQYISDILSHIDLINRMKQQAQQQPHHIDVDEEEKKTVIPLISTNNYNHCNILSTPNHDYVNLLTPSVTGEVEDVKPLFLLSQIPPTPLPLQSPISIPATPLTPSTPSMPAITQTTTTAAPISHLPVPSPPPSFSRNEAIRAQRQRQVERAKRRLNAILHPEQQQQQQQQHQQQQYTAVKAEEDEEEQKYDPNDFLIERLLLQGVSEEHLITHGFSTSATTPSPSFTSMTVSGNNVELGESDIPDSEMDQYIKSPAEVQAWLQLHAMTESANNGSKKRTTEQVSNGANKRKRK